MAARRINLLPPDLAQRRRTRQMGATIGAAGLALVALFAVVYFAQELRLRGERTRLEQQEDRNADIRADIASLGEFRRLEERVEDKTRLLEQLTESEVRWSVVLADISLVIPSDVWLTQFTGTVNAGAGGGGAGDDPGGVALGTIQMSGSTFSHIDVASWLTRLAGVDEFAFPYLTLSQKGSATVPIVTFSSSVELSDKALRRNQRGARRKI